MKTGVPKFCCLCSVLLLGLGFPLTSFGQFDNFDDGNLGSEWHEANFNPALVNLSFPDDPTGGKALRIRANPVPDAAPAAALLYRDEVYTNFYMAMDLVDWPGTDKNQAIVLVARGELSENPATTTAIIMNYDASQEGEAAGDRRQGQLQINMVTNDPAFGTKTIAVAEVTFEPGRPYRFVFEGNGSQYTARAYDLFDLTQPVVTLRADDEVQATVPGGGLIFETGGFKSGKFGVISFSREGTSGTTDATIDNYFVGAEDPVPTGSSALAHPVAGTPTVVSRTPAERFKAFHNPADGISFSVRTFNSELINAGATKLRLNGADVSSQLVLPANGTNISVTLPGSALASNTVYSAQIEVQNLDGTKRSTNTFWFDTFSEGYLTNASVKVIEAEEYNYNSGEFQNDPIPGSGYDTNGVAVNGGGVGYLEQVGTEGVDYEDNSSGVQGGEFRSQDFAGIAPGIADEIEDLTTMDIDPIRRSDYVREKHRTAGLPEYIVYNTEAGEWLNYTRNFEPGTYAAYLRVASFGATDVELHQVTSDPTQPEQTTTRLGTFEVPNLMTRYNYRYIPLVNEQGQNAVLNLSGRQTLRLQMAGIENLDDQKLAINYLLLVPQAAAPALSLLSSATVDGAYTEATDATINTGTQTITVPVSSTGHRFFVISAPAAQRITSATFSAGTLTLRYQAQ